MQNELSTSQSRPITKFKVGASFAIKTTTGDYAIDYETAERLSNLVVANNELKFVKVETDQGIVVINTASIMAIAVDESDARAIKQTMQSLMQSESEISKSELFEKLNSSRIYYGHKRITQEVFDYLYSLVN